MSKDLAPTLNKIESALITGDLARLSTEERLSYYKSTCESLGLNPLTQPFAYITLNGKLTLYARRDCTDQLRNIHGVSINITSREKIDDVYIVTAKATNASGREDESTGCVSVGGLSKDALANAFMKAETKAKRRVTLSICGLGLLDETEVETIPDLKEKDVTPDLNFVQSKPESEQLPEPPKEEKKQKDLKFTSGKFVGKKLSEVSRKELSEYVLEVTKSLKQSGRKEPKWFSEIRKASGL